MTEETNTQTLKELTASLGATADVIEEWLERAKEGDFHLNDVATILFQMKTDHKDLDTARKRVYKVVDTLEKFLMPKMLDDAGLDMIRVPEIARSFSTREMMSARMTDKEEAMKWLRVEGHGDLIQETVNAGTLASFAKSLLADEGVDLPEEFFSITTYKTTGINKYTPK